MAAERPARYPAHAQDWFSVAISIGHDRTVRLVLELDGSLDHSRLSEALRRVISEEPVLGCRFVVRPFRAYWRSREDLDSLALCSLQRSDDVQRDLHAFMAEPIEPLRDPLVRLRIFRSAADTLCIKISHAAVDGGGLKQFVFRLVSLYRALGENPDLPPRPLVPGDRGQAQVLRLFRARARLKALLTQPFHKKNWGFPFTGNDITGITFSTRFVALPVSALRVAVKSRGATIGEALVTSFAKALFEITDPPIGLPMPFIIPVDLRRYLPDPGSAGMINLSSLGWITLVRKAGATFEETLAEVHRELEAMGRGNPGIGLAAIMEAGSRLGYAGFRMLSSARARAARRQGREFPSLSNIGPLDPGTLGFGDVQLTGARFYAPVLYPPTFGLIAGSFADTLYYTASYAKGTVEGDIVERFLDRMVAEIESLG